MLKSLFEAFKLQKENEKIYVIIDEYDHFANELLGFRTEEFKNLVSKNGKIRKMCLYMLSYYARVKMLPEKLIDMNIASDYSKLGKMLDLCKGENRTKIIEKTISGEGIISDLVEKFNPAVEFEEKELISMLYYLGYLTITGEKLGKPELSIPNKVMKDIYLEYFLKILSEQSNLKIEESEYNKILEEFALEGKIDKIVEVIEKYMNNLSNRDYMNFDEKYVKLIFYCISMNFRIYSVKSEMKVQRKYPDILLVPREREKGYKAIMVEFKYLKKGQENKLEEMQKQAKEQIEEYASFEDIKNIENLHKYTIVAINDKLYVEKIS